MSAERITIKNLRRNWVVPLLLLPTVAGVGLFRYTPAFEAVRHCFYHWDGAYTEELVGLENFRRLLGPLRLWAPLLLAGVLGGFSVLVANRGPRLVLRSAATCTLLVSVALLWGDARGLGAAGQVSRQHLAGLSLLYGIGLLAVFPAVYAGAGRLRNSARFAVYVFPLAGGMYYLIGVRHYGDSLLWLSFRLISILILANLIKFWPSIFTAVCIHRVHSEKLRYFYRVLFVVPMIIPQLVGLLVWKFFYDPNVGPINKIIVATGLDTVLIWLDKWVFHLGVFNEPFKPAWLGNPNLIIPALIFWGFPWVGVVGVLIYLAGLQNIGNDVYEAAEIDGITSWGKFWRIELPLIMTQVRLNLILMVIGTFQAYGFQLILLGPEGGPGNKGMTPGLYMFYKAFIEQKYGYACAIGMLLFFIILTLTVVNQRYVRIEK